jgi:hypothetical protein
MRGTAHLPDAKTHIGLAPIGLFPALVSFLLGGLFLGPVRVAAAAEEVPEGNRRLTDSFSARIGGGGGFGTSDLAARAGIAADYWLAGQIGIGLETGILKQAAFGASTRSLTLGPQFAVRGRGRSEYWLFSGALGYAVNRLESSNATCPGCSASVTAGGGYSALELGHFYSGRLLHVGLGMRGEIAATPESALRPQVGVTVNLMIGIESR